MYITIRVKNQWVRAVAYENPLQCKIIDTGKTFKLSQTNENVGIF